MGPAVPSIRGRRDGMGCEVVSSVLWELCYSSAGVKQVDKAPRRAPGRAGARPVRP